LGELHARRQGSFAPLITSLTCNKNIVKEKSKKNLRISYFFFKLSENEVMTSITGYTVSELIEKSGKTRSAIESWISRNGVKPIIGELLYPPDTLDRIREASRGRPAKRPKL
jgi:hypothetical protein